jgi:hypothetical protein
VSPRQSSIAQTARPPMRAPSAACDGGRPRWPGSRALRPAPRCQRRPLRACASACGHPPRSRHPPRPFIDQLKRRSADTAQLGRRHSPIKSRRRSWPAAGDRTETGQPRRTTTGLGVSPPPDQDLHGPPDATGLPDDDTEPALTTRRDPARAIESASIRPNSGSFAARRPADTARCISSGRPGIPGHTRIACA